MLPLGKTKLYREFGAERMFFVSKMRALMFLMIAIRRDNSLNASIDCQIG